MEYAKFILVCAVVPNFLAFLLCLLVSYVLGYQSFLCGRGKCAADLGIWISQVWPDYNVRISLHSNNLSRNTPSPFSAVHLNCASKFVLSTLSLTQHIPGLYLFVVAWTAPFLGTYASSLLSHIAFLVSWIYLRFYKRTTLDTLPTTNDTPVPTTLRGDASETFSFASFFPDPIQPPIVKLSNLIFSILVQLGLCRLWSQSDVELSNSVPTSDPARTSAAPPGRARAEAERRRYI
jgi:hypothetical protein